MPSDEDTLMKRIVYSVSAAAIGVALLSAAPAAAQQEGITTFDLGPNQARGQLVAPYFEGWYANADGTFTLSFGYFNANTEEVVDVPIGPDNFITPAEFNGVQPTHFPPVSYGGFNARRERGVFAVTVPAEFKDRDVVWTITVNGKTSSVPGRVTSPAYELGTVPMAMGSLPPSVRFAANGPAGLGPQGVYAPTTVRAKVGSPVELSFLATDDRSERKTGPVPVGVTWHKHQGPGEVAFTAKTGQIPLGETGGKTMATFSAPGEYVVRVRVDNHRAPDSSPSNQCCWTNGYVKVSVTQ
jgi:hypothetical protein